MRNILFVILIMITAGNTYAQYVSVDTVKLNKAYRNLMASNSQENQEAYFEAFPSNWMEYIATYQCYKDSKLKNSQYSFVYEQVKAFGNFETISYVEYCRKLVNPAVGAKLDLGASNYLQILLHA